MDSNGNGDIVVDAADSPQPEPSQQEMHYPAVLVMRVPTNEPGREEIRLMEMNGIDALSIPTLLRLAANIKTSQLGL